MKDCDFDFFYIQGHFSLVFLCHPHMLWIVIIQKKLIFPALFLIQSLIPADDLVICRLFQLKTKSILLNLKPKVPP